MKFRDTADSQQTAELELAPMIDVVFLLLIFFLVSWQFASFEQTVDISTPATEEAEPTGDVVGEIIVNVLADGRIVLNGSEVTIEDLLERFRRISDAFPNQAVILRGHADTGWQAIVDVLDPIKKAGIRNVAFSMDSK